MEFNFNIKLLRKAQIRSFWFIYLLLILFGLIIVGYTVFSSDTSSGAVINPDGSSYWEKDGIGRLEWDKHTTQSCAGTRFLNVTSFLPSQDLDVCLSTDRVISSNRGAWIWKNTSHVAYAYSYLNNSYTQYFVENDTSPSFENGSWIPNPYDDWYFDWYDISGMFSHQSYGGKEYYCLNNIYLNQDQKYEVKLGFGFGMRKLGSGWGCDEKFGLVAKRSVDSIAEVLSSDNYIELDPFVYSNFGNRTNLTLTTGDSAINNGSFVPFTWDTEDKNMRADLIDYRIYDEVKGEELQSVFVAPFDRESNATNNTAFGFVLCSDEDCTLNPNTNYDDRFSLYWGQPDNVTHPTLPDELRFWCPFEEGSGNFSNCWTRYNGTLVLDYLTKGSDFEWNLTDNFGTGNYSFKTPLLGGFSLASLEQNASLDIAQGGHTVWWDLRIEKETPPNAGVLSFLGGGTDQAGTAYLKVYMYDDDAEKVLNWKLKNSADAYGGAYETSANFMRGKVHLLTNSVCAATGDYVYWENSSSHFGWNGDTVGVGIKLSALTTNHIMLGCQGVDGACTQFNGRIDDFMMWDSPRANTSYTNEPTISFRDAEAGEIPNTPPDAPSIILNFTNDDLNFTNESMWCEFTVTDDDALDTLSLDVILANETSDGDYVEQWRLNNAFTGLAVNDVVQLEITPDNFTKGDYLICEGVVNDGTEDGSYANSTSLVIENYYPHISDPVGGLSIDEDFTAFQWVISGNYTDVDSLTPVDAGFGGADVITWNYFLNDSTIFELAFQNTTHEITLSSIANQSGSVEVIWQVIDSSLATDNETVVWTVNAINDFPEWGVEQVINQSVLEDSGSSFTYNLDNISWDVEDDANLVNMTYGIDAVFGDNNASGTNCSIESANLYCLNEQENRSGDNILNLTALDADGAMASVFINISTLPVNDIPVWEYDMPNQTCNEDDTCTVEINLDYYSWDIEDDANGVNMTYSIVSETGSSIIDCELNVSGTDMYCTNQDNNQSGDNIVNISAVDADGSCESIQFNASVMGVNDSPDVPFLNQPLNNTNFSSIPEFNWNNSTDLEADPISYVLQIDESPEFTEPVTYYNGSITETDNTTEDVSVSLSSEGGYFWRTLSTDSMDNSTWSEVRYFTYDVTPPLVIIDSPINITYSNETIDFNFTAVDNIFSFEDLTFWYSNNSGIINYSISFNLSLVFEQDYSYHLNLWVNDTVGNENVTSVDFMVDSVNPALSIVSPHSGGSYSNNVPLEVSIVDTNLDTVWYEVIIRQSGNSKLVNTTFTSNLSLQNLDADNYRLHIYANDSVNNVVTSSVEFSLVDSSTGGGSGGGGGASSPIAKIIETISQPPEKIEGLKDMFFPKFDIDLNKIEKKSFADIKKDEFISFTVNGYTRHSITVSDFDNSVVTFEIASNPQTVEINLLDSKDIDVNGDGLMDINIYVAEINPDSVSFILKRYLQGTLSMAKEETQLRTSFFYQTYSLFIFGIIVAILFIFGYNVRKKKWKFSGFVIAFVFAALIIFENWKALFQLIGWKVIPDTTVPFALGLAIMVIVWALIYYVLFRKRRKKKGA